MGAFSMMPAASATFRRIIIQLVCSLSISVLLLPGSLFPLGALLIALCGTAVCCCRYRCMKEQPTRGLYAACCLAGLWGCTALNLSPVCADARLSLGLLAMTSLLCLFGRGLSRQQRLDRFLAYWIPVGLVALIPFSLRDSEAGDMLVSVGLELVIADAVFSLIGAARNTPRRTSRASTLLLVCWIFATCMGLCSVEETMPGLRTVLFFAVPGAIATIAWGRRVSDHLQRSCGIQNDAWLRFLAALTSALIPIGLASYALHLSAYFSCSI